MSNRRSLAISPCPNDTFVFHALLHGLVDTEGVSFDVHFQDIETLNRIAVAGEPDIVKASVAVADRIPYTLLDSGAAIGYGNGPIVVGNTHPQSVALPGEHTTAAKLFARYFPQVTRKIYLPFFQIAQAVASGAVDSGVLIHEGRFTFAEQGLQLVCDLGQRWEEETRLPIPLGAIFARGAIAQQTERIVRRSVEYALAHPAASRDFVRAHAQELNEQVLDQHICCFVNDFTVSLGSRGAQAIAELLKPTTPPK